LDLQQSFYVNHHDVRHADALQPIAGLERTARQCRQAKHAQLFAKSAFCLFNASCKHILFSISVLASLVMSPLLALISPIAAVVAAAAAPSVQMPATGASSKHMAWLATLHGMIINVVERRRCSVHRHCSLACMQAPCMRHV
jgi:hypothetical protein